MVFHTDRCDVISLLGIRVAPNGGANVVPADVELGSAAASEINSFTLREEPHISSPTMTSLDDSNLGVSKYAEWEGD